MMFIKGGDRKLRFNIGDILNVDGEEYHVIGRITYKNTEDGMHWDEYRLRPLEGSIESWLSVDETFDEYSVSTKASIGTSTAGYHLVDQGTEVVVSREGNVDVDPGDRAQFLNTKTLRRKRPFPGRYGMMRPRSQQAITLTGMSSSLSVMTPNSKSTVLDVHRASR